MSWLSNATGIHLGNIGAPVGAALGSIVPGVGTALGAGIGGALGGLGHGDGLGKSALEGAGAYGVGKLASHLPGSDGVKGAIGKALGAAIPGLGAADGTPEGQGSNGLGGNDWGSKALIGAQIANAAYNSKKQGDYANNAMGTVQAQWDKGQPLRDSGMSGLLNPGAGIHASVAGLPQGSNPFAHQSAPMGQPGLAPAQGPPQAPQGPVAPGRPAPFSHPPTDPRYQTPSLRSAL